VRSVDGLNETDHRFYTSCGTSVALVRCRCLKDLLVLEGTTKSTRKKSPAAGSIYFANSIIQVY